MFAAARAAQCEEFIGRLEHGWDTTAGDAGKQLSGGERQRIAIAPVSYTHLDVYKRQLMMCAKVQKVGSVLLMGLITGLIYYVTGQFTVVILVSFVIACGLAELIRGLTHYRSMAGNLVSFVPVSYTHLDVYKRQPSR